MKAMKNARTYYDVQHEKLAFKAELSFYRSIRSFVTGTYLDVACGVGYVFLFRKGIGCDFSKVAVQYAKAHFRDSDFIQSDSHYLPFRDGTFDSVSCLGSLEHFDRPKKALSEMTRVLKDEGVIVISVSNRRRWTSPLSFLGNILSRNSCKQPIETPYSVKDFMKMCEDVELSCITVINPHQIKFKTASRLFALPVKIACLIDSHIHPFLAREPLYICKKLRSRSRCARA